MPELSGENNNLFYLIDGHAQIFRSFYAIRTPMTSPITGEPTGATFAFTGMLIKLMREFAPPYVAMAIDSPGKTFRDDIYPDYKANREAPPEDFAKQIPRILEITRLFGIPILEKPGAEADDIMATITARLLKNSAHNDIDIRLVSKDKDLGQLLNERVRMFDIHTDTTIDTNWLKENKGVTPEQVIDMLCLMGDNIDNIPGAEGIGPKTAAKLLNEFGNIDNLFKNLDQIKGKRKENLEKYRPFLDTARKLVTLDSDVDIDFDINSAKVKTIDTQALAQIFKTLGFNRHLKDLLKLPQGSNSANPTDNTLPAIGQTSLFAPSLFDSHSPVALEHSEATEAYQKGNYKAVTTKQQLDALVKTLEKQPMISVDSETIGLGHRARLCGLCIAWKEGSGVYVPVSSPKPHEHLDLKTVSDTLKPVLENPDIPKCGHNLKYDFLILRNSGINLRGIAFDSMIAGFLLEFSRLSLDHMALSLLSYEMLPITNLIGERGRGIKQKTMDKVPLQSITPYAVEDADITLRLCNLLRPKIKEQGMEQLSQTVEMPLIEVLAIMEDNGIKVNPQILLEQRQNLEQRIKEIKDNIYELTGAPFNIDSPKQLAQVLFTDLGLPVIKKTKTGPSTDIEVLEKLTALTDQPDQIIQVPKLVAEYRQLSKLVSTYLVSLEKAIHKKTGRVHASFHQTGAATGRLSSSNPNLQNIPVRSDIGRQIRRAFVAEPNHILISCDYSQVELRMLAHLSEDQALIDAFQRDQDIHTAVAAQVFGLPESEVTTQQRAQAKVINFGIVYGVTAYGLARRIENLDVSQADKLIKDYRSQYPGIDQFLDTCIQQANTHGYVTTILGRRRHISGLEGKSKQGRAMGQRLAVNTVVQGSAADLIKLAMVHLQQKIEKENLPIKLLVQIHDELVIEAPKNISDRAVQIVKQTMEQAMQLKVPLKVEAQTGKDWYEAK